MTPADPTSSAGEVLDVFRDQCRWMVEGRAAVRQAAWAAGAGPDLGEELRIDRRVAAFVVVRTSMLEAQHRASTLS
jgi:hypothetical protein